MKIQKRLTEGALKTFKAAYEEEFGDVLTDETAQEIAFDLLQFFDAAYEAGTDFVRPI
jgi:hypothetical protein